MVATGGISGTVVATGEPGPVFSAEVFVEACVGDEFGEQFELVALGARHFFDKFLYVFAATEFPVESTELEHTPEGSLDCRFAVDVHSLFESGVLCGLLRTVAATVGTGEYFGM